MCTTRGSTVPTSPNSFFFQYNSSISIPIRSKSFDFLKSQLFTSATSAFFCMLWQVLQPTVNRDFDLGPDYPLFKRLLTDVIFYFFFFNSILPFSFIYSIFDCFWEKNCRKKFFFFSKIDKNRKLLVKLDQKVANRDLG